MDNRNKNITKYKEKNEKHDSGHSFGENDGGGEQIAARRINLPNKLTIFRIILVPVFMVFILLPEKSILGEIWPKIFAAALFFIASLTDFIDGFLARRLNLITDFGRLMDPLADKFMVLGAMVAITAADAFAPLRWLSIWATALVLFRELAVTSLRLVVKSSDEVVISANFSAKVKTLLQIVCIMTILLEKIIISQNLNTPDYLFSYITMAVMIVATVYSGFVYFKKYWGYINPKK